VAKCDLNNSNQTYSNSIHISTNYGATWSAALVILGRGGTSVATSDNGQYILAGHADLVAPALYMSINTGSVWTRPTFANVATNICSVSMSSTGQYMLAGIGGHTPVGGLITGLVYYSNDYGTNWNTASGIPTANWQAGGMSSTGQYMWVGSMTTQLYKSVNYGASWSEVIIPGSTSVYAQSGTGGTTVYCNKITISTNGQIVALTSNTTWCVSSNGGSTWNITNAAYNANFNNGTGSQNQSYGMQASRDGGLIITGVYNSNNTGIFYTTNYGVTWLTYSVTNNPTLTNAYGVSGNGSYILKD
jgi:hypothetical protein